MATYKQCDRCGRQECVSYRMDKWIIVSGRNLNSGGESSIIDVDRELCDDCARKLVEFLKPLPKPDRAS